MNMPNRLTALTLGLTLLPLMASAEGPTSSPFSITGDLMVQTTEVGSYRFDDLLADVQLAWRPVTDTAISYGLDASLDSFVGLSDDTSDHGAYASVIIGFDGYDLRVGAPHPVTDTMALLPDFGGYGYESNRTARLLGSHVMDLSRQSSQVFSPGLSLQSTGEGSFSWGVSAHRPDLKDEYSEYKNTVVEAVGQYDLGDLKLGAQLVYSEHEGFYYEGDEAFSDNGSGVSALATAVYTKANWLLGLSLGRYDAGGTSYSLARVYGGYRFDNGLTLVAEGFGQYVLGDSFSYEEAAFTAEYSFANGTYLKAGTSLLEDGFTYNSLSMGFRF